MSQQPTLEQIRELPRVYELTIPESFTDANGHVNIARYLDIHSDAGWAHMHQFGLGEEHAKEGGAGMFDVDHRLRYLREMHAGDRIAVHVQIVERTDKAVRTLQYIVNETREELANTLEAVSLSVDLATRRVTPWSPEAMVGLDERFALDQGLSWQPVLDPDLDLRR
ncbi:MAG: thioesterase family protein [Micrococcales bacterium]|nr:thioesterase family protein [Micrococcales bacterium]